VHLAPRRKHPGGPWRGGWDLELRRGHCARDVVKIERRLFFLFLTVEETNVSISARRTW
jgi:hypothetical protein